jgi:hypothetical protein
MDMNRAQGSVGQQPDAAAASGNASDVAPSVSTEINLGDFTRTQGLMKSLRLLLNNQLVVQVEDIASGVSDAGRKFKLGELEQANQDVARLYAAFGQRTNQWESQARNLEQQMKMQAAKNPKSISIDAMNRMKAEQTAVRTRIRTAEVHFRRLQQGLDLAFTNFQKRPAVASTHSPGDLPPKFLVAFENASPSQRSEIVKTFFEIESKLTVQVTKGMKAGYDIRFDPVPPLNRLYFLTQTAEVIRLKKLGNLVVLQDVKDATNVDMKLVEFVKQVQSGVWLLKPATDLRQTREDPV